MSRKLERMSQPEDSVKTSGMPGWAKVTLLVVGIALLALLIMIIVMAPMGGDHGPGRHMGTPVVDTITVVLAK